MQDLRHSAVTKRSPNTPNGGITVEGMTMIVIGYLALTGIGFVWLMTRAPLWRAFEISIDHGLDSGAREPGTMG